MLEVWTGSRGVSFLISTGILFLWTAFSLMDAVISTARFFINKPYVREIVKVREVEPEKPKAQRGRPAAAGIVGLQSGSKPREVLVDSQEELGRIIAGLKK